jgi:hypothetical protein
VAARDARTRSCTRASRARLVRSASRIPRQSWARVTGLGGQSHAPSGSAWTLHAGSWATASQATHAHIRASTTSSVMAGAATSGLHDVGLQGIVEGYTCAACLAKRPGGRSANAGTAVGRCSADASTGPLPTYGCTRHACARSSARRSLRDPGDSLFGVAGTLLMVFRAAFRTSGHRFFRAELARTLR